MINVSANQNIYGHGIQVERPVLEFSDLYVGTMAAATYINAGRPVRLAITGGDVGKVHPVTTDVKVLGLAKSNANSYVDETYGTFGAYGSGKMTVVSKGVVIVRHSYFQTSTGSIALVSTYSANLLSAAPMDPLFVDANGLITNAANGLTTVNCKIGTLLVVPTAANPACEIFLDC